MKHFSSLMGFLDGTTQVASVFFKEVVARLIGSFSDRCLVIYGPGVPVLENPYEHKLCFFPSYVAFFL